MTPQEPISSYENADQLSMGTFIDYHRVLLGVLGDLRELAEIAAHVGLAEQAEAVRQVRARLEQNRFTVAVVGEFKRGKSTFINALLGADALPTDVLPCSATLNRVTYGLKEAVTVEFRDGRSETVPFERLADYVTKLSPDSATLAATVKQATIYYPTPYCQNNVDVIDTPGLNDDKSMTDVTLSVLPSIDAAIMVILAQSPFSEFEREFLETRLLASDLGRVVFVANGIDMFRRPGDADRVIANIEERVRTMVLMRAARQFGSDSEEYRSYVSKIGKPRVFGISSLLALEAKQKNNAVLLEQSRLPVFERELQRFLTEKRGAIVLQVPLNRAMTAGSEIRAAIDLRQGASGLEQAEFEKAYTASVAEIEALRQRKVEQLAKVVQKSSAIRDAVLPLFDDLRAAIPERVAAVIDNATIEASELDDIEALQQRIGKLVEAEIRLLADNLSMRVQAEVSKGVMEEAERLSTFADDVGTLLTRININFNVVKPSTLQHGSTGAVAAAAMVAALTGLGGIYNGYRDAGLKGAAVGVATSVVTAIGAGILVAAFAIPLSLPIVILVGVGSMLPTGAIVRRLFRGQRIDRFRDHFKAALLKHLGTEFNFERMKNTARDEIDRTFNDVKAKLEQETEIVLRDAESQLTALRTSHERKSTLDEQAHEELEAMKARVNTIADNAARLSRQLIEVVEI